jgi:cytoskeletal protein CcmA (bactofilin family)
VFSRKPNDSVPVVPLSVPATAPKSSQSVGTSSESQRLLFRGDGLNAMTTADTAGIVVIGRGTKITGQITDCARLEIQGTVDGSIVADTLIVREGGVVKGDVRAAHAEIHGLFEGQLAVQDVLDVRGTGHVEGDLSYGKLAVAMGGYISGKVSSDTNAANRMSQGEQAALTQGAIAAPLGVLNGSAH